MNTFEALAIGRLELSVEDRILHQLAGVQHNFRGAGAAGETVTGDNTSIDRGDLTLAGAPLSTITVVDVDPGKPRHTFIGAATANDVNVEIAVRVARVYRVVDTFTLTAGAAAIQRPELRVGANSVRITMTGVGAASAWFIWSSLTF